jgi:murein DD-endopeptidase MepM/ murein hydrolase activator NlpD
MNNQKTIFFLIYAGLLALTLFLTTILFLEYSYFKREAYELSQVKEAYYQHVDMLKRSLNASMVDTEQEETEAESEKKKINDSDQYTIDFEIEAEPEVKSKFQIISEEEDRQLKQIRQRIHSVEKPKKIVSRKKRVNRKIISNISRRSNRYVDTKDYKFSWPIDLQNFWLSSLFGPRKRPNGQVEFHHAIDMAACKGTPVKAAASGKVTIAYALPGYGNCVMIEHNSRYKTRYAHLHKIYVQVGQYVQEGQEIASVGDTGLVRKSGRDASHLHFEIHQDGSRVNPLAFLFS